MSARVFSHVVVAACKSLRERVDTYGLACTFSRLCPRVFLCVLFLCFDVCRFLCPRVFPCACARVLVALCVFPCVGRMHTCVYPRASVHVYLYVGECPRVCVRICFCLSDGFRGHVHASISSPVCIRILEFPHACICLRVFLPWCFRA